MAFDILFLGSSANNFSERLKTDLKNKFDKDARRSSSILLNKNVLVDCGIHTLNSLQIIKKDFKDITDIFITHLHPDHFNPENISEIAKHSPCLRLWVRKDAVLPPIEGVKIKLMEPYKTYKLSGFNVASVEANHGAFAQHFVFSSRRKRIYYATDGAWILNPAFNFIKNMKFDLMVLDCTVGDYEGDWRVAEHNSIPMLKLMLESFKNAGMVTPKTQIYGTHLAPCLHKPHAETVEICNPYGINIAYDGLQFKI